MTPSSPTSDGAAPAFAGASGPPAYAWDWFARQRLLWQEVHRRLATATHPAAGRYAALDTKAEVIGLLRADYPRDPSVRDTTRETVAQVAFLGRTGGPFAALAARNPPRGMRWWWWTLTGEVLDPGRPERREAAVQLRLDDVHEGYGG